MRDSFHRAGRACTEQCRGEPGRAERVAGQLGGPEVLRLGRVFRAGDPLQQGFQHARVLRRLPAEAGARQAPKGLVRRREVRRDGRRRRDGANGPHSRALALGAVGDETSRGIVARAGRGKRTRGEETVAVREQDSRPRARPRAGFAPACPP